MNLKKFLLLIPLAAVALVLIVYAAIWYSGTRYVRYESEEYGKIRFIGKLNEDGVPADGKVYYSDGKKAVLSVYDDVLEFRDGTIVKGDLFKLEYSDGNSYIGELQGLIRDGRGVLTFTGGDVYEGGFLFGSMTGSGSYYYKNGDVYIGDFKDGVKWGSGCYTWAGQNNGVSVRYIGEYLDNMRHGKGAYTYSDGSYYDGYYEYDAKCGKGTMTFASGDRYEGDFVGDLRSGKGVYTFASGDSYEGDFYRGQITGFGTYHWASGDRPDYTGYFENGVVVTVVPDPSQPETQPTTAPDTTE